VRIIAAGAFRKGGQELVIEQVLSTRDDISGDELGLGTARNTGLRVADMALRLAQ
jgi:hypothetical protein